MLETKTAFWELVTSRANAALLQDAIRAYEAHIEDARNREKFGLAARSEVLAVEVERDRAELDRLRAEAGAELAEANLRRLLDLPPTAPRRAGRAAGSRPAPPPDVEALVLEAQAPGPSARRSPRAWPRPTPRRAPSTAAGCRSST